jgi:hypothetical protein
MSMISKWGGLSGKNPAQKLRSASVLIAEMIPRYSHSITEEGGREGGELGQNLDNI